MKQVLLYIFKLQQLMISFQKSILSTV